MTCLKDTDKKLNIITQFGRLFKVRTDFEDDSIPEAELLGYTDPANVCMVIPLKKSFKLALINNFDVSENKAPNLDYSGNCAKGTKYSCEYLKIMLELTKHYDSVRIKVCDCYPLTFETDDFRVILAPRVED